VATPNWHGLVYGHPMAERKEGNGSPAKWWRGARDDLIVGSWVMGFVLVASIPVFILQSAVLVLFCLLTVFVVVAMFLALRPRGKGRRRPSPRGSR